MQRLAMLLRDVFGTSAAATAVSFGSTVFAVMLGLAALGFLTAGCFGYLAREIGPSAAAMSFALFFALMAILVLLLGRSVALRRQQRATAARMRLITEVAAARALLTTNRAVPPLVAFILAFALARR